MNYIGMDYLPEDAVLVEQVLGLPGVGLFNTLQDQGQALLVVAVELGIGAGAEGS